MPAVAFAIACFTMVCTIPLIALGVAMYDVARELKGDWMPKHAA